MARTSDGRGDHFLESKNAFQIIFSKLKFIILTIKYISGIKYNIDTMPDFLIKFTIILIIYFFKASFII